MEKFTISVFTEDKVGLLARVTLIFTRRKINIESITASESELEGVYRFTIVISSTEERVKKIVQQVEKQVEVLIAFFHAEKDIIYQEIAMYKVHTPKIEMDGLVEGIIRKHHARILSIEKGYLVIEKTGHPEELHDLFIDLKQNGGLLEYNRSGRVAITKPMKDLEAHLREIELF